MSIISQQLQRTRLESLSVEDVRDTAPQHPGVSRAFSGSSATSAGTGPVGTNAGLNPTYSATLPARGNFDRAVSSSSIGRSDKIDEETGMFEMEADGNESGTGTGSSGPSLVGNASTVPQDENVGNDAVGATRKSGGTYADHAKEFGRSSGNGTYWSWSNSNVGRADPGVIGGQLGKK